MSPKRMMLLMPVLAAVTVGAQEQQRIIRGTVRDSTGRPIPFAVIQGTVRSRVIANDSGGFEYRPPSRGEVRLLVRRIGYQPFEARIPPSAGDTTITLVLAVIPRRFDAINIVANRTSERLQAVGFYERMNDRNRGVGSGSFITAEDIEQRNPLRVSQMLDQLSGVRVQKMSAAFDDFVFRGPGGMDARGCPYTVYLNGARIGPRAGKDPYEDEVRIDRFLEPSATGAIEVYPRATSAPPHLQMLNGTCGVVAFWTK